jgi:putative restriction endonuclease
VADIDQAIRTKAFDFLAQQVRLLGDVLPFSVLTQGFKFNDQRVPLLGPQGIFKPAAMRDMPLSITTAPAVPGRPRPYQDEIARGGRILYRYRGGRNDIDHRDNAGLRRAMRGQVPLVYLHGVMKGHYFPAWPAYVVADDPDALTFTIVVDEASLPVEATAGPVEVVSARREYVTRLIQQRVHQAGFRQRVIHAYQRMCAICRLRHEELLDAAHILPDGHPSGEPIVPNGLALCKLHHSAFDQNIIGIRPDLVIEVNEKVLQEVDGPMLVHGLQGFHASTLIVPRRREWRPRTEFLQERYETFRNAG